jgi:hypothetical protein
MELGKVKVGERACGENKCRSDADKTPVDKSLQVNLCSGKNSLSYHDGSMQ